MSDDFRLTCMDTPDTGRGVGLALALETPGGGLWLYDTGCGYPEGDGWLADFNAGRDLVAPFMEERGYERIDGVVISHAHYDHFGGLLWLAEHHEIGRLVDSGYEYAGACDAGYSEELADYTALRERFRQRPDATRAVTAGDTIDLGSGLAVEVVSPPSGFYTAAHSETRADFNPAAHYMLNSNSLILRIQHGDVVFLLGGDIEKEDQARELLPRVDSGKLRCDVLVAPGHGLHTAPEFAEAARPATTLVSLFPRWLDSCSALPLFEALGSKVYVTGLHGTITVTSDGRGHRTQHG